MGGDAADLIASGQYRYSSAVFQYEEDSGVVLAIHSAALTNNPALDELDSLSDLSRGDVLTLLNGGEEPDMSDDKSAVAVLQAETGRLTDQVAALTKAGEKMKGELSALAADRDAWKKKYADLEGARCARRPRRVRREKDALLETALSDERMMPAEQEWAQKQSLESLTELLATREKNPLLTRPGGGEKGPGTAALSAAQKEIWREERRRS
uniref:Mu-like prophage I protein n=1 Tax=Candidatus Kentrum sp. TC TaxID=2126339 RepID=A0A450Z5K1_9GAMM|nr:MAG: Mu-like prophage I protein [Candidatus Kentron sp. TC]